jgi:cytochrome o ubiquinol oxidase subunit 2
MHAVLNKTGTFEGFSANYSGSGFSNMRFKAHGMKEGDFNTWATKIAQSKGEVLDTNSYLALEAPSEKEPVRHYAAVSADLFDRVVNLCVRPGKMCQKDMMALDARGGTGKAGAYNVAALTYDKYGRESTKPVIAGQTRVNPSTEKAFVRAICAPKTIAIPLPADRAAAAAKFSLAAPARTPLS